jgi:hypothetical protein
MSKGEASSPAEGTPVQTRRINESGRPKHHENSSGAVPGSKPACERVKGRSSWRSEGLCPILADVRGADILRVNERFLYCCARSAS